MSVGADRGRCFENARHVAMGMGQHSPGQYIRCVGDHQHGPFWDGAWVRLLTAQQERARLACIAIVDYICHVSPPMRTPLSGGEAQPIGPSQVCPLLHRCDAHQGGLRQPQVHVNVETGRSVGPEIRSTPSRNCSLQVRQLKKTGCVDGSHTHSQAVRALRTGQLFDSSGG